MEYMEYVKAELLILVPFLYGLGAIIKTTNFIKDKYIPLILTGVSLLLTCLYVFGTEGITYISIFTAIVQAVLVTAAAVFSNQLIKQATKK